MKRLDLTDGEDFFTVEGAKPLSDVTGQEAYDLLTTAFREGDVGAGIQASKATEGASKVLNEAGIPGIRFLDGSSRGGKKSFMVEVTQAPEDGGYTEYMHYASREKAEKAARESGGKVVEREGTRNIVVFNPDDITQVKRDGELVYKSGSKLEETIDLIDKY